MGLDAVAVATMLEPAQQSLVMIARVLDAGLSLHLVAEIRRMRHSEYMQFSL
jgi:hypothetical protein